MGYLNNQTVIVDAVLTRRGRELLATSPQSFNITQFALSDDEVDYNLWNENAGTSDLYGNVIEKMPITQAITDDSQLMKYKLMTLSRGYSKMPYITCNIASYTFNKEVGEQIDIQPATWNAPGGTITTTDYTAILTNASLAMLTTDNLSGTGHTTVQPITSYNAGLQYTTAVGIKFYVRAIQGTNSVTETCDLIISGNDWGGRIVIPLTFNIVGTGVYNGSESPA